MLMQLFFIIIVMISLYIFTFFIQFSAFCFIYSHWRSEFENLSGEKCSKCFYRNRNAIRMTNTQNSKWHFNWANVFMMILCFFFFSIYFFKLSLFHCLFFISVMSSCRCHCCVFRYCFWALVSFCFCCLLRALLT